MSQLSSPGRQDPMVKQEPSIKQEPSAQHLPSLNPSYHPQQTFYHHPTASYSSTSASSSQAYQHHHQQQPTSSSSSSSSAAPQGLSDPSTASFASMSATSGNYNLSRHLLGMNMQQQQQQHNPTVSSGSGPLANNSSSNSNSNSNAESAANTPIMGNAHLNPSSHLSSAPPSPTLNNLHYQPSAASTHHHFSSGGNGAYAQSTSSYSSQLSYQTDPQHSHPHGVHSSSDLSSGSYYSSLPPFSSHPHQQQESMSTSQGQSSHHPQHHHSNSGGSSGSGGNGPHVQFNSTAPSPMRQHQQQPYSSLVPPLSDTHYAQYHQLLGPSAFSSAQSSPYHSNHSTPYSSMPGSPTQEYQQLSGSPLGQGQKPKRRQVKNACVNCQKACKKCDEGRPCSRCIKYGLTDTCVDSTRKVRKKGIKRGPYKRRPPPSQLGSASVSTSPTMRHAAVPSGLAGYMSEPVTALNSPTQTHALPFTTSNHSQPLDFGYDTSGGQGGYPFQSHRMESTYAPSYASYSGSNLYTSPYGISSSGSNNNNNGNSSSGNNNNSTTASSGHT
ncbi:hypothetical protein EC991_010934 [Linnemannia zychae]|nr:hypothetical protein EC991_010934 [Linnemannia zychae]